MDSLLDKSSLQRLVPVVPVAPTTLEQPLGPVAQLVLRPFLAVRQHSVGKVVNPAHKAVRAVLTVAQPLLVARDQKILPALLAVGVAELVPGAMVYPARVLVRTVARPTYFQLTQLCGIRQ